MKAYLLNAWYMIGWTEELTQHGRVSRTLCDIPITVFRSGDRLAALADICPHRFAPLSLGRLVDGGIQCKYHGLSFGVDGRCIHNPHGPIAGAMKVRSFPVIEFVRGIWVWLGAPERADANLLPDITFLDGGAEAAANRGGYLHGKAHFLLYVDNLMDLSHVNFLHTGTLGSDSFKGAEQTVTEDESSVTVLWSCMDLSPAPYEIELGKFAADAKFDQRTEVQWYSPSSVRVSVRIDSANSPSQSHSIAHMLSPETASTVHYFYAATRDFRVDDVEFTQRLGAVRDRVFATEDSPMVEAVQKRMGTHDLFSLKPLLLRTDEAAVRVRRKFSSMLERTEPQ
jgi:phenylpropionate dioxygenase-like ring-hydroxylating dioxygenase large terminal subunit